jgi:hypothetical protein
MRPNIDDHDYDVKMKAVQRFFEEGDKVKLTLRFRGREMAHMELGMKLLNKVKRRHCDDRQGRGRAEARRPPDDDGAGADDDNGMDDDGVNDDNSDLGSHKRRRLQKRPADLQASRPDEIMTVLYPRTQRNCFGHCRVLIAGRYFTYRPALF